MHIDSFRLLNVRCFEDTKLIKLNRKCNIFIGINNIGKTTIVNSIVNLQLPGKLKPTDARYNSLYSGCSIIVKNDSGELINYITPLKEMQALHILSLPEIGLSHLGLGSAPFQSTRPYNKIVPILSKRKSVHFDQSVNSSTANQMNGTYDNIYAKVNIISNSAHEENEKFLRLIKDILNIKIGAVSSPNGVQAGFYFGKDQFISLEEMGDGSVEIIGLICDLCLAENKVFVIEEPESSIHPRALKGILNAIKDSINKGSNQFIITTHSNIVLSELGNGNETNIYHLTQKDSNNPISTTEIKHITSSQDRLNALSEVGYEFSDYSMHEGWLFLEEASAQSIIERIISLFIPKLAGRLRIVSCGGSGNIKNKYEAFRKLYVFTHLSEVYKERTWVWADYEESSLKAITSLKEKFNITDEYAKNFSKRDFEEFYPSLFQEQIAAALALTAEPKRKAKEQLLLDVLNWSDSNLEEAKAQWQESAAEVIEMLKEIEAEIIKP